MYVACIYLITIVLIIKFYNVVVEVVIVLIVAVVEFVVLIAVVEVIVVPIVVEFVVLIVVVEVIVVVPIVVEVIIVLIYHVFVHFVIIVLIILLSNILPRNSHFLPRAIVIGEQVALVIYAKILSVIEFKIFITKIIKYHSIVVVYIAYKKIFLSV